MESGKPKKLTVEEIKKIRTERDKIVKEKQIVKK